MSLAELRKKRWPSPRSVEGVAGVARADQGSAVRRRVQNQLNPSPKQLFQGN